MQDMKNFAFTINIFWMEILVSEKMKKYLREWLISYKAVMHNNVDLMIKKLERNMGC